MKRLKVLTAGSVLLTMVLGASGAALAETAQPAEVKLEAQAATTAVKAATVMVRSAGMLFSPVHERKYMQLLVQAYAPESAAQWSAALEERKQVESEMSKTLEKQVILKTDAAPVEAVKIRKVDGTKEEAGATDSIRLEIKEGGELHMSPAKTIAAVGTVKKELTESMKLQDEFAKAVESGDASAIQALLPKLLDDYTKQTAEMKQAAEKMKTQQPEQQ
ncbi:hypothetical protein PAESOLCIP111_04776 [Paenibacillus solanacearum]|uniref:Uncharacterized protein n=1 Tax=Paenibacillus solanacearum TaxID=2048548 RepID=A0A916K856_9BACL|nr:hypothetical protein [Paenibacillus solanacearum]CAG7644708.1 hypothetical protein PAESOLCIP111_04776 [Paenibacillus solanacearum]